SFRHPSTLLKAGRTCRAECHRRRCEAQPRLQPPLRVVASLYDPAGRPSKTLPLSSQGSLPLVRPSTTNREPERVQYEPPDRRHRRFLQRPDAPGPYTRGLGDLIFRLSCCPPCQEPCQKEKPAVENRSG